MIMNLKDEIGSGVTRTSMSRKITIEGVTTAQPVYRIPLNYLFYNDRNDRIATWISEYRAEHDGQMPDSSDHEKYNSIIEEYIVKSNPDAIKKTQNNIELVDQREPGVVLMDGRIIDGNRRFTCLRRLAAEKGEKFNYFEAVILDRSIEKSAKQIKIMELNLQHGEEAKVDYNPIDRLVGIYHDIVETKLLTVEEYARASNETVPEVDRRLKVANLMVEFLDFIGAPKKYHLARELQIYYPLEEYVKFASKIRTEDEAEDWKISVFNNILMNTGSDTTRFIRDFKKIVGTKHQQGFLEEQKDLAEKVLDKIQQENDSSETTSDSIRNLRADKELTEELKTSAEKAQHKVNSAEILSQPVKLLEKAETAVNEIRVDIVRNKLSDAEKERFAERLDSLLEALNYIKGNI